MRSSIADFSFLNGRRARGTVFAFVLVLACLCAGVQAAGDGLVAHWRFDEGSGTTAADSSGNGNNGTITGATWTAGRVGSGALSFDGTDDFVNLPYRFNDLGANGTVALWFRMVQDFGPGSADQMLIFSALEGWSHNIRVGLNGGDGKLQAMKAASPTSAGNIYSSVTSWTGGVWYHVCFTFDTSGMKLYINGSLDPSTLWGDNVAAHSQANACYIGKMTSSAFFSGSMDDVRIYNRALSGAEADALYRQAFPESLVVQTLAGSAGAAGSADGLGGAARFNNPLGIAADASGNVYVSEYLNHTIRKITPAGVTTTLAGVAGSQGSADGTGAAARFSYPYHIAIDGSGSLYVADANNHVIRKVTPAGVVSTVAGLAGTIGSADGTATAARFYEPRGVCVDGNGNLYIADSKNNTIRKMTGAGVVTTLAGSAGVSGSADGNGATARFYQPTDLVVDSAGNVIYVADFGNRTVRRITAAGDVTTVAGAAGVSGSADGAGAAARFDTAQGLAMDKAGNLYVADLSNHTVRMVTPAGVVTTVAGLAGASGTADGVGSAARFLNPEGVAIDSAGIIYVTDCNNHTIRRCAPPQAEVLNVTTLAGLAGQSGSADGTGSAARFNAPTGVAVDSTGNVYVADTNNYTFRKITPGGVVTTLAGTAGSSGSADGTGSAARFYYPYGVAVDSASNLYVTDSSNHTIRTITAAGVVTTLAGTAGSPGSADGTGSAARFNSPIGVAVDSAGNVYAGDYASHTIRKIAAGGVVTTLAGTAGSSGSADGTGSAARFYWPEGVAVDSAANVYVADYANHTIRKVTAGGVVTTLAGTAGNSGSADGIGSEGRLNAPVGVAVDNVGNVYVADYANHTIRKVTAGGVVTTLAGRAGSYGSADGTGSAARFYYPYGVTVDGAGNVYNADNYNHTIRKCTRTPTITSAVTASGTVGAAFSYQITANNNPTSFNATNLPAGLEINTGIGAIVGTPTTPGQTAVTISATNSYGTATATLTITITGQAPAITSSLTATGTVGQPFSYEIKASGSTPMTFEATPLPAGLSLSGTTISGTPTTAGTTNVALKATNSAGSDTKTLAITINPTGAPTITSALTATGQVAQAFSYQITASGNTPMTFNASGLPAGLSLSGNTISGTPTVVGKTNATISATNASGTDTKTLELNINAAGAPTVTSSLSQNAKAGTAFSYTITATGTGPITFGATGLPAWLALNGAGLSGTPQAADVGNYTVSITATNASGTDSKELKITVSPATGDPPVVTDIYRSRNPVRTNTPVTFTAEGVAPSGQPLTYRWYFFDSTGRQAGAPLGGKTVTFAFPAEDKYTVVAVGNDGFRDSTNFTKVSVTLAPNSGSDCTSVCNGHEAVNPNGGLGISVPGSLGGVVDLDLVDVSVGADRAEETFQTRIPTLPDSYDGRNLAGKFSVTDIFVVEATGTKAGGQTRKARLMVPLSKPETGETTAVIDQRVNKGLVTFDMKGKFTFGQKFDAVTLKTEIELPAGLAVNQPLPISVGIGNVAGSGSVDSKGRVTGVRATGVKKVQVKWPRLDKSNPITKGGEKAKVTILLMGANLDLAGFDTEGIVNTGLTEKLAVPRNIQTAIVLGGVSYYAQAQVNYTYKKGTGMLQGRTDK